MQKRNLKKSVFPAAAVRRALLYFHSAKGGKHSAFCISAFAARQSAATARRRLHSSFSPAFSLIELIVVMMVVGILATVVIIKFIGVDSQSNRIAANDLRSHLTYIRNTAMNRERAMMVQFSVVSNKYDVFEAVTNWTGTYRPAKDPVTQKDWTVDLGSKFSGVTLLSVDTNINTLYFSETNGTPFGAGWARLTTNGVITFISGLKVTVTPVTGYADLE